MSAEDAAAIVVSVESVLVFQSSPNFDSIEKRGWDTTCPRQMFLVERGYKMSGGTMVVLKHFCEPCFERMLGLNMWDIMTGEIIKVKREDYDKVEGETLYDATTK